MRYLLLVFGLLFPLLSNAQDVSTYKVYSYSEFFQMVEDVDDSVVRISNVRLTYDHEKDTLFRVEYEGTEHQHQEVERLYARKDTLFVSKKLILKNVHFDSDREFSGIYKTKFSRRVTIENLSGILEIYNSKFKEGIDIRGINQGAFRSGENSIEISYSSVDNLFRLQNLNEDEKPAVILRKNVVNTTRADFYLVSAHVFVFSENQIRSESMRILLPQQTGVISFFQKILNNSIDAKGFFLSFNAGAGRFENTMLANQITHPFQLDIKGLSPGSRIEWKTFEGKMISSRVYDEWQRPSQYSFYDYNGFEPDENGYSHRNLTHYLDHARVEDHLVYETEIALRSKFYNFYRSTHNNASANAVYLEMKDLETERLRFLYHKTPNFTTFFDLQINRFLKVFSDYGTRPAKAIVFSAYVILAFAFVYLFFPNYWDSHGKNRIMNRYRFFTKYMKKDSGIHEVYLEEKNNELMASEDFKTYMLNSEKGVPGFFMATALPLYRWSVAGTKTFSWLLSKVDVLKGKWSDTEDSKKAGKSFLLITAFLIALLYDLFIKMLNALMLSINTFTTLGFGEIPIKGLPRYMAIIQGFIGWFMLTIFSVSLISQLLN
ncbi:MAG: two pore domain potassium channel family protein [Roseivirga sp.]|nr:two pore domain potassium channel family protein [Roseivirga sp.]